MHPKKTLFFGSYSLINFIMRKVSVWVEIRESYHQLQLHQKRLEALLHEPARPFTSTVGIVYGRIKYYWSKIAGPQFEFEDMLHMYKMTTPSKLEMALYYEYLLHATAVMKSCRQNVVDAGFDTSVM